jgi:[ribosomal protein S18]-alanine N-acetyltransferase
MKTKIFNKIIFFHRIISDYFGSLKVKKHILSSKKIRTFNDNDLEMILDLYNSCFGKKDHYQILKYPTLFRNTFYIYEENDKIIAYLGFYIHLKIIGFKLVQEATVYSECVAEKQRGKGLFTDILKESLLELKNNNVGVVYAFIRKDNIASLHVHQKLGFKIIDNTSKICGGDGFYQVKLKLENY